MFVVWEFSLQGGEVRERERGREGERERASSGNRA